MKSKNIFIAIVLTAYSFGCTDSNTKLEQQNKQIAQNALEIVNTGDFSTLEDFVSENYIRHCQATPEVVVKSFDDFKEFLRQDRLTFPDQKIEIINLVAEDDMVAFWAIYKGTQKGQMGPFPPTNKYAEIEFSGMHKIVDGKIAETWIIWDNVAMLSQLGLFPPPSSPLEE